MCTSWFRSISLFASVCKLQLELEESHSAIYSPIFVGTLITRWRGVTHQFIMSWSRTQNKRILWHKIPSSRPWFLQHKITRNTLFPMSISRLHVLNLSLQCIQKIILHDLKLLHCLHCRLWLLSCGKQEQWSKPSCNRSLLQKNVFHITLLKWKEDHGTTENKIYSMEYWRPCSSGPHNGTQTMDLHNRLNLVACNVWGPYQHIITVTLFISPYFQF